jgi:hypothetical protein
MEIVESPSLLLREVTVPQSAQGALRLLTMAGWPRELLAEWSTSGMVLELYDPAYPGSLGAAIVHPRPAGCFELRAWAIAGEFTDPRPSTRLLRGVADALRAVGAERLLVAVGGAQLEHLAVLKQAGFRVDRVEPAAPSAWPGPRGNGSRDLVWMDQEL